MSDFIATKKLALQAARDFKDYGVKGYDTALITALKSAKSETEIRDLLRKARAISEED